MGNPDFPTATALCESKQISDDGVFPVDVFN